MTPDPAPIQPEDADQLEERIRDALALARRRGASAAEAGASLAAGLSVGVRMGEVETIEHNRDRGLGVTVYFGTRKGSASTADFSKAAIEQTVQAACDIARHTGEDPCAGIADADRMPAEVPDLDLFHPWDLAAEQATDVALAAESAARGADPRITNSEGATVSWHAALRAYGNSHGFVAAVPATRHGLRCSVIASRDGAMQRGGWYTVARDAARLEPPEAVGREAAARALARLGARRVPTCAVPVVFAAEVAGGLVGHFVSAVSGSALYRRSSFLLDRLGQAVFPPGTRIHEQPHLPGGLGSTPFDSEGVETRARDLVSDGVLRGYVLGSYAARKLGLASTGNAGGVHNLTLEPGPLDRDGLLGQMQRGLLITQLMGMGINIVTGDYSRGASGFWIEGGEIQHPVEEITVAGNLERMFSGIEAVGSDVDLRGNIRTGSILIDTMTIAGE